MKLKCDECGSTSVEVVKKGDLKDWLDARPETKAAIMARAATDPILWEILLAILKTVPAIIKWLRDENKKFLVCESCRTLKEL